MSNVNQLSLLTAFSLQEDAEEDPKKCSYSLFSEVFQAIRLRGVGWRGREERKKDKKERKIDKQKENERKIEKTSMIERKSKIEREKVRKKERRKERKRKKERKKERKKN